MTINNVILGQNIDPDWGNSVADTVNALGSFIDCSVTAGTTINTTAGVKAITSVLAVPSTGAYTVTGASGKIAVTYAGNYEVSLWMSYANTANTAAYMQVYLRKNGSNAMEAIQNTAGPYNSFQARRVLTLAAGDYVDFTAYTTASTCTTRDGMFSLRRIS